MGEEVCNKSNKKRKERKKKKEKLTDDPHFAAELRSNNQEAEADQLPMIGKHITHTHTMLLLLLLQHLLQTLKTMWVCRVLVSALPKGITRKAVGISQTSGLVSAPLQASHPYRASHLQTLVG